MITRIVKMKFKPGKINEFYHIFNQSKSLIQNFPGCQGVQLLQDHLDSASLFTLSYWESTDHLEHYRKSELFLSTWARTKILFDAKPVAWSLEEILKD